MGPSSSEDPATHPLTGVRVVEIAQNLAGRFAGLILARLGADVIKVERPEGGDDARGWGPPFVEGAGSSFHAMNAGKRSITVDFKDQTAIAWLRDFAAGADVVVENMRPGLLDGLGLGADSLRARNPRLIYCSVSAFGKTGPLRLKPGYEPMMQAFAGLMMVSGVDGGPPSRLGIPSLDFGSGMWAAIGTLAALAQRHRTGRGATVDASLFATALGWMTGHFASWRASGKMPERHPTGSSKLIPFQGFETRTGPIIIAAGNDRLFVALSKVLERPEWGSRSALPHQCRSLRPQGRAARRDRGNLEDARQGGVDRSARRGGRAVRADPDAPRSHGAGADAGDGHDPARAGDRSRADGTAGGAGRHAAADRGVRRLGSASTTRRCVASTALSCRP